MSALQTVLLDETIHFDLVTHDPVTGSRANADATPTFAVFELDNDTPITGGSFTLRDEATGHYRAELAISDDAGFEIGKTYHVVATATKGELTAQLIVTRLRVGESPNIYPAEIQLTIDAARQRDEYTVSWFRNGTALTSGISEPTIRVVRRSNGEQLIAQSPLAPVGDTGVLKYDESLHRLPAGEAVVVVVRAVIDEQLRSWRRILSRDSSAV